MNPFHRLGELTEDWNYLIHRDGLLASFPIVVQEILKLPYRKLEFHLLGRSLIEPLPNIERRIGLEIIPFQQSHIELVREIHRPSEALLCARRQARGQNGLIAFYHDQPAGYAWVSSPLDWELERVHFQIEPSDILCTDVYTAPSLRGLGVQTALTQARLQIFRDLGYRRAICYIEINNLPSLAVWQRKFNAHIAGKIYFLRIGPWYRVRSSWDSNTSESSTLADVKYY